MSDRWMTPPQIGIVPSESAFNALIAELDAGAKKLDTAKAKAIVGVLGGITWQADGIAAYIVTGKCRGLMQITREKHDVEIDQWVTAADARGVGGTMLEWLVNDKHATTIKLFPIKGTERVYENLGFVKFGEGGFMRLQPKSSNCWAEVGKVWHCYGPPPPPPPPPPPTAT